VDIDAKDMSVQETRRYTWIHNGCLRTCCTCECGEHIDWQRDTMARLTPVCSVVLTLNTSFCLDTLRHSGTSMRWVVLK
jgi:hypothetical protein